MDWKIVESAFGRLSDQVVRNSPGILTGLGVAGLFGTTILAIGATSKAKDILRAAADSRYRDWVVETEENDKVSPMLTKKEIVSLTWKQYIPTAISLAASTACIIGANTINGRRTAALASLYALSETALKDYKEEVVRTLGESKEEKIRGNVAQTKLDRNPATNESVIITGCGETWFFESLSGRYFKSSMETIRRIQNDLNQDLLHGDYLTINDMYDLLGLEHTELGTNMGWTTEYGIIEMVFTSKIAHIQDVTQPCVVIDFRIAPRKL